MELRSACDGGWWATTLGATSKFISMNIGSASFALYFYSRGSASLGPDRLNDSWGNSYVADSVDCVACGAGA